MPHARQLTRDAHDLLRRLSLTEDDLGRSLTQCSMVVHRGVAEVRIGELLELSYGIVDGGRAALYGLQKIADSLGIHAVNGAEP